MDPKKKQQLYWMLLAFAAIVMVQGILGSVDSPERISYSKFLQLVDDGAIKSVEIRETEIHAATKDSKKIITQRLPETDDPGLTELLRSHSVEFSGKTVKESWWQTFLLGWIFPIALIFLVYTMFQKRMGGKGGPLSFGKSRAQVFDRSKENPTTFADVAGVDEAEAELREVVDFLKHPEKYQELGARIPRGVLLLGPPGTGKTLLARAVAGEADVPFYSMSGSEFVEMFVGVGAARMRSLFAEAKEHTPCIVFLDELDAIGKARGGLGAMATNDEREQTLNQLLIEMDGFEADTGVVVMAATNRPEVLDQALVRAGRFDRQIAVDAPNMQGREAILKIHARKVPLDKSVDLEQYSRRTPGMVGADLANVINEASLAAARRESKTVSPEDFEEAIDRIQLGLKKSGKIMSDEERERVAVHESGHALVAHKLEHADPVYKITIVPRSIGALGATLQLPEEDRQLHTKEELLDQICVMLGGRSAEELVCESISTGASNDIERATEIARQMVNHYGMSELGVQTFGQARSMQFLKGSATMGEDRNFSEHTAEEIDRVIHEMIETEHERAKSILGANRDELEHLSQTLLIEETIDAVRLVSLLAELTGEAPTKDETAKDEKPEQETQTKDESPKKTITSPESLAPQVDDELPAADDAS